MYKLNVFRRIRSATAKQAIVTGVFVLALAGAVGLGLATKQNAAAATARDCSTNSVDFKNLNGGCGAMSASELVADMRQNDPGDLQTTYSWFGLSPDKYDRFASSARQGVAYTNGDVVVDGQVVMRNAWSIGRTKFSYSSNYQIGGTTFYKSMHTNVLKSNHDVMVMFDANGVAEAAVLNACGNAVGGDKVPSAGECKQLNMSPVEGKLNTYRFTSDVAVSGNATIEKVVYTFSDGTKVEKANGSDPVEKTFTQSGSAKVQLYIKLPGGQTKVIDGNNCVKQITVQIPFYVCEMLSVTALNAPKNTEYRFAVKTRQGNGATLKDVDFVLDGKNTTTGVTAKDDQGRIYKDYAFAQDGAKHTVVAKVNFNLADGIKSVTCEANITTGKAPVCEVPGKEMFPPNAPECAYCPLPGKEKLPKDSPECKEAPKETPELPKTGMGGALGLFAGTSALGAVAHRVVQSRRHR